MNSLLTISCIGLLFISCEKKDNNDTPLPISGQLISNSTCKNELKSTSESADTPDSLSSIEYAYDTKTNKLTIKHINAGFNCCPDSLYCNIELQGDTIVIEEFEKNTDCKCNCLYDLDIEVANVEAKEYKIKFVEPYSAELSKLEFQINLSQSTNGSYSVTRKLYPWGVNSLNK